jgi:hypothetical protein
MLMEVVKYALLDTRWLEVRKRVLVQSPLLNVGQTEN